MEDTRKSPYHEDKGDKFIQTWLIAVAVVAATFFCCYMYVRGH